MKRSDLHRRLGRRAFLSEGALMLGVSTMTGRPTAAEEGDRPAVRFGLITDLHYADKPPAGTRHYRETPAKLAEAAELFREERPAFLVELGDLIDAADSVEVELGYLDRIDRGFAAIADRRYYVLGNHCVDTLTKREFLGRVGQDRSYFSFDEGGFCFVVLDSCFRSDGEPYGRKNFEWTDPNLPAFEVDWLRTVLEAAAGQVIVFAHQRLDVGSPYGIRNAAEVREVLEASGKVRSVFQGHSHKNDYQEIGGIHYVTLVAMVEGSGAGHSGYALVDIGRTGDIRVRGFRMQEDYSWRA
jgi:alkaline phosphatase